MDALPRRVDSWTLSLSFVLNSQPRIGRFLVFAFVTWKERVSTRLACVI